MRTPRVAALALVGATLLSPAAARACRPIRVPLAPADLGVLPEACEGTEVSLETRAAALIATPDLYGSLQAGVGLRGRLTLRERTWLSLWAPSLEYRFVANGSVESDRASLGGAVVGAHHRLALTPELSLSPFVRVLLPTETGFERGARWGGEHGISAVYQPRQKLELVGGFAFGLVSVWNGGRATSLLTESLSVDAVYRPWRALGIAAGAGLRFGLADAEPFESFDPRLGLRLYPFDGPFLILNAALPLWGRDRTDLGLAFSAGWQL